MEETTTVVPFDGFDGGDVTDGGAGGGKGAVPVDTVFFGGGGGGGVVDLWHPPLQLVTTMVEVVRVV